MKTIKELRAEQVEKLAKRIDETEESEEKARKLMNAFYRLCGLDERLLHLENNERTANLKSTNALRKQEEKRFKDLKKRFEEFDCNLIYFGYLPTICEKGSTKTAIERYFY